MKALELSERKWIAGFLLLVALLVGADVVGDYRSGSPLSHMLVELTILVAATFGAFRVLIQNRVLLTHVTSLKGELQKSQADAQKWKQENAALISGLSGAIDDQLKAWNFTESEKEIALLLLKGLSLKEIAELRKTSDRTVRQQSLAIYAKSGLAGRAELAAFFLEDLLVPIHREGAVLPETGPGTILKSGDR